MEPKVSIVMPSLNVVRYIKECIDSVVNQSLRDIEIICVDAGSTDGTWEILKEYETEDERIHLLKSNKRSCGYQMNLGVDYARGKYIGIVETDDCVPREMYEELYALAEKYDVDFVKADYYRFTGEVGKRTFTLEKVVDDSSYYNRVINVPQEKDSFYFKNNIWNGIYRRDFLKRNNIRQNETLGASYQDNGFWFQTFMYANKIFLSDKAYYMNRRDNAGSSVHDLTKVFCISDEYHFLENILRSDSVRFSEYKFEFTRACFVNYHWNLGRIPFRRKKEFLALFSRDFQRFVSEKMIDLNMLNDFEKGQLFQIVYSPDKFAEKYIDKQLNFYYLLDQFKDVYVYGAGQVGKIIMGKLKDNIQRKCLKGFVVSSMAGNDICCMDFPVILIDEIVDNRLDCAVLVGVGKRKKQEVVDLLAERGFANVITIPDYI